MTLVTSLIDIAKMVQMDLENTERQLETELKKGQAKRAFAKVGTMLKADFITHLNHDGNHLTPTGKESSTKCWVEIVLLFLGYRKGPLPIR